MLRRLAFPLLLLSLVLSLVAPALRPARAQELPVQPPPCDPACPITSGGQVDVRSYRVDAVVADQVATTTITEVFHNPNSWVAEGTYLLPIPEGATIDALSMLIDGEPIAATIYDADQARAIYDDIVRQLRDPALLEYVGRGLVQASVFPIQPGQERTIQITYREVLPAEQGLVRYSHPLDVSAFSARPIEQVSVRVAVTSAEPIRAVYSPSHQVALDRPDDHAVTAGWEASNVLPTTDFDLIYTVSQEQVGANLLSYVDPATGEGYFLLLAAPGVTAPRTALAKDVVVVLDTSGSMEGEKFAQAQQALVYVLEHLGPEDRFAVVDFSTGVRLYADELRPAADAPNAVAWAKALAPTGGTDINRALLEGMALVRPERPTYLMFLTDGLPTEGEIDVPSILDNVAAAAPANVRLFAFGVGDDVDAYLLDSLVAGHAGASSYVRPGERIDEVVSAFYAKVSTPVLTDLTLATAGVTTEELYPQPLPDLFAGSQLVVTGRYRAGGPATITLAGNVNGAPQTFTYEGQAFATAGGADAVGSAAGDAFVPRLWATRKIGYLQSQIRLNGENPELVQAIVDLSVRWGIVTEYTSYLITEDDILTQSGREDAAAGAAADLDAAPTTGSEAVDVAASSGEMQRSEQAAAPAAEQADRVVVVEGRTFLNQGGVWTETTFDPSTMTTTPVVFASDAYFALLDAHPDLAGAFALGDRVVAITAGTAYEVVPA